MCPHLRIEDRISKMKVMQKDNMTVRSWRRLHRGTGRDWYAEQNSAELNGGRKPLL